MYKNHADHTNNFAVNDKNGEKVILVILPIA